MNRLHLVALAIASLHLAGCEGGGGSGTRPDPPPERPPGLTPSDPEYHLGTERFTTHQPQVLEKIGAHHAFAKGLTGRGVRIGIEDSMVDYTQTDEFGNRVRLRDANGAVLAYSHPLFEASTSLMSAGAVRIGTASTGVTLEQPLRAESGTGTFRLETGWIEDGRRLRADTRVPLRPEAREVRMTLRHERETGGGQLALELSRAGDAGHVAGEHDASAGLAWRMTW